MAGPERLPERRAHPTCDLVRQAFEAALRGDPEALEALLSILKTRYGQRIFGSLRHHRGHAHTATLDDIFQESLLDFMEKIRSGALAELPESERRHVVGYFQKLCDRKLENLRKARKDPILAPNKDALPFGLVEDKRNPARPEIPGAERATERHLHLLNHEISKLDPFDRLVLERHLSDVSYRDIAEETGVKVPTLESLVSRLKQRLADRIAQVNPTARIRRERRREGDRPPSLVPSAFEIRTAIQELPIETQRAIEFVHLKKGTVEALARSLGPRGREKAEARLKRGYESLATRLDLPFPDSFSLLES